MKKILNERIPIILLIFGTFIFSHFLRNIVLPSSIKDYNLFFILFLVYAVLFIVKIDMKIILLVIALTISYLFNILAGYGDIGTLIYYSFNIILPLLIIGLYIKKENRELIIKRYIKIFNFLIFILLVMAILDKLSFYEIAIKYWEKADEGMLSALYSHRYLGQYRFYSFMGHPLYNAQLFLMFFVVNSCYNKYFTKMLSNWTILILSSLGVALTASKTGLILLVLGIIFLTPKGNKFKYYISLVFLGVVALASGVFNDTIERLLTTSLTTGRGEVWSLYKAMDIYPIKFLTGYGLDIITRINEMILWGSAAFEYPIRGYAIQNGVLFTIIIYIIMGIYPAIKLFKNKNFYILIGFGIIFLDVNTYNTLLHGRDYMIIYALFVAILLNISIHNKEIVNEKESIIEKEALIASEEE